MTGFSNIKKGTGFLKEGIQITANTVLTIDDLKEVIQVIPLSTNINIYLPLVSTVPNDGLFRAFYIIKAVESMYKVNIYTQGSDSFLRNFSKLTLNCINDLVYIGAIYNNPYLTVGSAAQLLSLNRGSTIWNATNFSSAKAIPFLVEEKNSNTDIYGIDLVTFPTRITFGINCIVNISFNGSVDSISGSNPYSYEVYLALNGTKIIHGTIYGGNYDREDSSFSLSDVIIQVSYGDYLELFIDQDSLSGNLKTANLTISTTI